MFATTCQIFVSSPSSKHCSISPPKGLPPYPLKILSLFKKYFATPIPPKYLPPLPPKDFATLSQNIFHTTLRKRVATSAQNKFGLPPPNVLGIALPKGLTVATHSFTIPYAWISSSIYVWKNYQKNSKRLRYSCIVSPKKIKEAQVSMHSFT